MNAIIRWPIFFGFLLCLAGVFQAPRSYSVMAGGLEDVENDILAIVERVRPAVLRLVARRQTGSKSAAENRQSLASFTGVLISPDGEVVTLAAYVFGASSVTAIAMDGSKYKTEVLGVDLDTNIALLRLIRQGGAEDGVEELPYVTMSKRGPLKVGSWTLAVGNPFGLENSVVTGMVSGQDRVLFGNHGVLTNLIQTTVPVNPGDSGGLVVDRHGDMVGLIASTFRVSKTASQWKGWLQERESKKSIPASLKVALSEAMQTPGDDTQKQDALAEALASWMGQALETERREILVDLLGAMREWTPPQATSFAIPTDTLRQVVDGLRQFGYVQRPWMGVRVEDLTAEELARYDLNGGVRIVEVYIDSPAAAAGLLKGDILQSMAGKKVNSFLSLRSVIFKLQAGDEVELSLLRDEKPMTTKMVLINKTKK